MAVAAGEGIKNKEYRLTTDEVTSLIDIYFFMKVILNERTSKPKH